MKKIQKYIIKSCLTITLEVILLKILIEECYIQRKGFYIGGEWLIVPIVLIAIRIVPSVIKEIINASKENDNDSKRIK